jgi:hypothetical protein
MFPCIFCVLVLVLFIFALPHIGGQWHNLGWMPSAVAFVVFMTCCVPWGKIGDTITSYWRAFQYDRQSRTRKPPGQRD